jgi:hypothetical protein
MSMFRNLTFIFVLLLTCFSVYAQKYAIEKSEVSFFSSTAIEDIKAINSEVKGLFNSSTYEVAFLIPIKNFQFDKSLMKEHFNEKYLESEKYPNAIFKGKIEGVGSESNEEQAVIARGSLTIHGVTREVAIPGTLFKNGSKYVAKSKFLIKLEDYKIKIPQLMWQNIAEEVEVTVEFIYKPI